MKRVVLLIIIAGVIAVTAGAIGYYYYLHPRTTAPTSEQQAPAKPSEPQNSGQITPNPSPNNGTSPTTYPVNVYFSKHPESDDDPSKVFPVSRTSPTLGVGTYAITQLLNGPTASEQQAGYFATARLRDGPSSCTSDFTLSLQSGVATLQFCKTFDHVGSISDGQAEQEIDATLLQFNSVKKVVILNHAGDCEFNLSGLNICKQ